MTSRPSSSGASPLLDNSPWHGVTTSSRTSADDVHARIRAMIYGGQLRPGNRLPAERRLSEMFSVSCSTLREALSRLRAEGYVDVRRGVEGGTFVTGLAQPYARWLARMAADETLLRDIIEVRMAVECQISNTNWSKQMKKAVVEEVVGLAGVGHRTDPQVVVEEHRIDPADSRGPVLADGGEHGVGGGAERRFGPWRELGGGVSEVLPRGHALSLPDGP